MADKELRRLGRPLDYVKFKLAGVDVASGA